MAPRLSSATRYDLLYKVYDTFSTHTVEYHGLKGIASVSTMKLPDRSHDPLSGVDSKATAHATSLSSVGECLFVVDSSREDEE